MKVLVTGADGFVGSNLCRELLKRNYSVVGFVQYGLEAKNIKNLDVQVKFGDLLDIESIKKAMNGCEALIHTAASTVVWPYRSAMQKKVNIEGTKNIMQTALDFNLKRVVHMGTANSFGYGSKSDPGNETLPYMAGRYKLDYMDTKYQAHQLVLKMIKEDNLPAVVVNPTFMFGPFPTPQGSAKMIESIYKEKVPGYSKGGRNYVAVKDICVATVNAVEKGKIGESYILGNENLSYKEIFTLIAKITGVKAPKIPMPGIIVKLYALFLTFFGYVFRFKPTVNYRMGLMSLDEHYYSAEKAVKELGLPQTPVETAIKEAYNWMIKNNYL